MSIYVNRVDGYIKRGDKNLSGVLVALYSQSIAAVIRKTHSYRGHWKFVNVDPGFYNIQFYNRGVTQDDWLFGLEVVDEATAGDSQSPTSSTVSASLES